MSEQYEPSYYEIALTGRQVLVAFVILLVCLVAAFFSGVWVGRGGPAGARQGQGPMEAQLQTETPGSMPVADGGRDGAADQGGSQGAGTGGKAAATDARTVPEQEGVDALSFFDEEAEGGEASKSAPERSAPTKATKPEPRPERPAESRPPTGAAGGNAGAQQSEGSKPSGSTGSTASIEEAQESANPSGSLAGGDVVIQVFSSSDQAKAQEILDRLKANDFRAFISPVTDDGRTLYRVRVGPFEHQDDAERVAAELRRRLDLDTWITR